MDGRVKPGHDGLEATGCPTITYLSRRLMMGEQALSPSYLGP